MSLRTPLGRVLGLGSAKDGTSHFWGQRVSGIALVILGSWLAYSLVQLDFSHQFALQFIAQPFNSILLLILVSAIAYHSYLGIQVVIEDYVHSHSRKLLLLILSRFLHVLFWVTAIFAILKIGFSS